MPRWPRRHVSLDQLRELPRSRRVTSRRALLFHNLSAVSDAKKRSAEGMSPLGFRGMINSLGMAARTTGCGTHFAETINNVFPSGDQPLPP
jgi:hypothetical protein